MGKLDLGHIGRIYLVNVGVEWDRNYLIEGNFVGEAVRVVHGRNYGRESPCERLCMMFINQYWVSGNVQDGDPLNEKP